ncbi:MAG: hypothetical protein PHH21_00405, partial [Candidatus Pacebacteria bacterium]|nr:hypothetical protein [Candidatus Paceibacterota bacterium]
MSNRSIFSLILLVSFFFCFIMQASAAISGGSVAGNAAADLVVNTSDADYNISFDTDVGATANQLWIIFPAGYAITNGDLGTSSVTDGTTPARISVNGIPRQVDNVTGDSVGRKITIVLSSAYDLGTGTGTSFRIVSGVQNPTAVGATGTFTIDSDAAGETEQSNVAGVTLTPGAAHHFVVTGTASQDAGADNELTVTAKDEWGNTATSYDGAHDLTFSGPSVAPDSTNPTVEGTNVGTSQSVTFASGVTNGSNLTLKPYKAEATTVDVTDGSVSSAGDASWDLDLTVNPATATIMAFSQQPAGSTSGSALTTQPIVTAYDDYDNIDTDFVETITLSTAAAGSLGGDVDVAASSGVATFVNVSYNATVDGQSFTLLADDEGALAQIESSSVNSNVVATKLVFTQQPSANATSATAFAQQPIV